MGMLLGGIIGGQLEKAFSYSWVFNINAILLVILFAVALYFFPSDPPPAQSLDKNSRSEITVGTLLKRFNCFSVGCVLSLCLFSFCLYESILQTTLVDYVGISKANVGAVQAIQGVTFLLAYLP
jgi:MFS family permease